MVRAHLSTPLLAVALLVLFAPLAAAQEYRVNGAVVFTGSGEPVTGASVRVLDARGDTVGGPVQTNAAGVFRIEVEARGPWTILISRLGFETVRTARFEPPEGARSVSVRIEVDPEPVELQGIAVEVQPRIPGYIPELLQTRKKDGLLVFFERDLERIKGRGLRVYDGLTQLSPSVQGSRIRPPTVSGCSPAWFVNNHPVEPGLVDLILRSVHADDLVAVEIYRRRIEVPPEYTVAGGRPNCVVAIWHR